MTVAMFFLGIIDDLPPLMTAAASLARHGAKVVVVAAGTSEKCERYLRSRNVTVRALPFRSYPRAGIARFLIQLRFLALYVFSILRDRPDVVWYHCGHVMRFAWLVPSRVVVAHAHEHYPEGTSLDLAQRAVARRASVCITPEENRSWMLRLGSRTRARSFVIPNRLDDYPEFGPQDAGFAREMFLRCGGDPRCRRFAIYQGCFQEGRCLKEIITAFRMLPSEETGLILLGGNRGDRYAEEILRLAKADSRIAVVPWIAPPGHLRVTSGCAAGFLLYAPTTLNNVYCAPNKLFEYAHYGIPTILPDYPGLTAVNSLFRIGEFCDPLDPESILTALQLSLERPPEEAAACCRNFLKHSPAPSDEYLKVYEHLRHSVAGSAEALHTKGSRFSPAKSS